MTPVDKMRQQLLKNDAVVADLPPITARAFLDAWAEQGHKVFEYFENELQRHIAFMEEQ